MPSPTGIAHGKIDIQASGGGATHTLNDWAALIEAVQASSEASSAVAEEVLGTSLEANYIKLVSFAGDNTPPQVKAISDEPNIGLELVPKGNGTVIISSTYVPNNAGSAGKADSICWDNQYIYIAIGTNSWKRVAITSW